MTATPTRIQSVSRAVALLELVAAEPGGRTASEAAAASGLPVSTAYHLLNTLVDSGLLFKSGEKRYQLGSRVGLLAEAFLAQISAPGEFVAHAHELAERTGETAYLSAWRHGEVVVVSVVEGHRAVRVAGLHLGYAGAAHTRASGKMLLASGRPERLARYLAVHDVEAADALGSELELTRARGYAIDEEEFAEGVVCIAALLEDGLALGISTPVWRYQAHAEELISSVVRVASAARAGGQRAAHAS